MDPVSMLGLNLPLYIVISLIFSYLIWSKFVKGGGTTIENVDDLLDIFSIFVFLMVVLFSFVSLFVIVRDLGQLALNIGDVTTVVPGVVTWLLVLGMWVFMIAYRKEVMTPDKTKDLFAKVMLSLGGFLAFYLGFLTLVLLTALKYVFADFVLLLFLIIAALILSFFTIQNTIAEIDLWKTFKEGKWLIIAIFSIFTVVGLMSIPWTRVGPVEYQSYQIYNPNPEWGKAYLQFKVSTEIKTFGLISSLISWVPIKVQEVDITGDAAAHFRITVNSTSNAGEQPLIERLEGVKTFAQSGGNHFGFKEIRLLHNGSLVLLNFDRNAVLREGIKALTVYGYIRTNMSQLPYSYQDNGLLNPCSDRNCTFVINISNGLKLPVAQGRTFVANLRNTHVLNISECKFQGEPRLDTDETNITTYAYCESSQCNVEVRRNKEMVFELYLLNDNGVVELTGIRINRPFVMAIHFLMNCQ